MRKDERSPTAIKSQSPALTHGPAATHRAQRQRAIPCHSSFLGEQSKKDEISCSVLLGLPD